LNISRRTLQLRKRHNPTPDQTPNAIHHTRHYSSFLELLAPNSISASYFSTHVPRGIESSQHRTTRTGAPHKYTLPNNSCNSRSSLEPLSNAGPFHAYDRCSRTLGIMLRLRVRSRLKLGLSDLLVVWGAGCTPRTGSGRFRWRGFLHLSRLGPGRCYSALALMSLCRREVLYGR
jgi:hypothetical protein